MIDPSLFGEEHVRRYCGYTETQLENIFRPDPVPLAATATPAAFEQFKSI